MPQLSQSVVEGEISRWLVKEGDRVELDQVLAEIITDKVDVEMPSPVAGTVLKILVAEGETVSIGTPLLFIGEEGESLEEGVTSTGASDFLRIAPAEAKIMRERSAVTTSLSSMLFSSNDIQTK